MKKGTFYFFLRDAMGFHHGHEKKRNVPYVRLR